MSETESVDCLRGGGRGGFTLVEVLVVSVIVGMLTGIALPSLGRAIDRAAASKVAADARNLSLSTRSFLEAGGILPASGTWGVAPTALAPYLEGTMTFTFRDAQYRFITVPALATAELWVGYPLGSGLGNALRRFRRLGQVTWTPTRTTFSLAK